MEIMAPGGITLTQRLSLVHKDRGGLESQLQPVGLFKHEQVEDLGESGQTTLGIRLAAVFRGKTPKTGSSWFRVSRS
jgi:hypothetical protein